MAQTADKLVDLSSERLRKIEARIGHSESEGLRARWEFGREILNHRIGKKLPAGFLEKISSEVGVSRWEINERVAFADRFSTEHQLFDAVKQWPTWHRMTQEGLVQKHKTETRIGLGSNPKREKTRNRIFALIDRCAGDNRSYNPKEWQNLFSRKDNGCLSVIPWVAVIWTDGQVSLRVDQRLKEICEGGRPRPELNGISLYAFLRQMRRELTRRRKENHDERIKKTWNPEAVVTLFQRQLLDWIEAELDRVPMIN